MKTMTPIDVLAARLAELAGDPILLGQTGFRLTIAPVPMHTPDAYTQCHSVDITDAGLARVLTQLGITPDALAALTAQPETGIEAA
ncbi:hypothetical protein ACGFU4_35960 [Streptomyces sp. NPDC048511]|uniref:hypothetical protein n=1 Tax=Streptomyces sp. NPDC048511 TaxID=3365562 RepID=UPI0037194001